MIFKRNFNKQNFTTKTSNSNFLNNVEKTPIVNPKVVDTSNYNLETRISLVKAETIVSTVMENSNDKNAEIINFINKAINKSINETLNSSCYKQEHINTRPQLLEMEKEARIEMTN